MKLQPPLQRGNNSIMSLLAELSLYFYDVIQDQIFMRSLMFFLTRSNIFILFNNNVEI